MKAYTLMFAMAACAALTGCERPGSDVSGVTPTGTAAEIPAWDRFMNRIAEHCGEAFRGEVETNVPPMDDDPFTGERLLMHVRDCRDGQIRIPFHVGDDRSRTWVLTRTEYGLQLKHDHRYPDGREHTLTNYGGDTDNSGTAERQEFPADTESVELFRANDLAGSVTNVWAMEIVPNERFVYELARPEGRLLRVVFDLSEPVEPPQD